MQELDHDGCITQAQLARILHTRPTLESTLDAVLTSAVTLCRGVVAAGANLYVRGRFEPQAVLGAAPPELDKLQKKLGTGPCIEASRQQETIVIEDTAVDTRWPEFGVRAQELGIGGIACAPLWVDEARLGSLSLYASEAGAFDPDVLHVAGLLATHAALAIAGVRRSENLAVAVESRDLIGQAKGILMERYRITADEAFELILTSSQHTHRKVQEVAELLASTGELAVPRHNGRTSG